MKKCQRCKELKNIEEFHRNKYKPLGKDGLCKQCRHFYNINQHRNDSTGKLYGLTPQERKNLLEKQENKCKICHKEFVEETGSIDHNKTTNKVRGILCNKCNGGLAFFNDDPNLLNKAYQYLISFNET